jgi:hypothetical protein
MHAAMLPAKLNRMLLRLSFSLQDFKQPPQLMDSKQFGQKPLSIGSALKCCSSPLGQQLSLQLEHDLLHADYEFDVIANIRLPQNQLAQEQHQTDADSDASSPCVVRSSYVGVDRSQAARGESA